MELKDRLNQLRNEKKWTQEEMSNKVGIARTTYAMYEQGKRNPDYETLKKIADLFDVSTDYLLGRTDIRNPEKKPEGRFFYDLDNASQEDLDELESYFKFMQERKQKRENKRNE
jgi:transcriptional regulator with XRE-family HTH domain